MKPCAHDRRQLVEWVRAFYEQHHLLPTMRVVVGLCRQHGLGDKASSLYVYALFPGGLKELIAAAGLPPGGCQQF